MYTDFINRTWCLPITDYIVHVQCTYHVIHGFQGLIVAVSIVNKSVIAIYQERLTHSFTVYHLKMINYYHIIVTHGQNTKLYRVK